MKIKQCLVLAAMVFLAAKSNGQQTDTTYLPDREIGVVTITSSTEIRNTSLNLSAPTHPIDNQSIFEDENGDLYVNCVGSFGYIPGLNTYIARTGVAILVDLYNKTIKVIDGLPHSNGHGVAMGKHGNKMVYGSANDEYNGFSTVDLTTGTVENKVVTVAGFPSFFYSFE